MSYNDESSTENLSDRLAALDDRIARMRMLNTTHGDAMALRLIEHAQVERKQILSMMPPKVKSGR